MVNKVLKVSIGSPNYCYLVGSRDGAIAKIDERIFNFGVVTGMFDSGGHQMSAMIQSWLLRRLRNSYMSVHGVPFTSGFCICGKNATASYALEFATNNITPI